MMTVPLRGPTHRAPTPSSQALQQKGVSTRVPAKCLEILSNSGNGFAVSCGWERSWASCISRAGGTCVGDQAGCPPWPSVISPADSRPGPCRV